MNNIYKIVDICDPQIDHLSDWRYTDMRVTLKCAYITTTGKTRHKKFSVNFKNAINFDCESIMADEIEFLNSKLQDNAEFKLDCTLAGMSDVVETVMNVDPFNADDDLFEMFDDDYPVDFFAKHLSKYDLHNEFMKFEAERAVDILNDLIGTTIPNHLAKRIIERNNDGYYEDVNIDEFPLYNNSAAA